MAAFDTNRPVYGSSIAVSGFFSVFARALGTVVAWNNARITRNALSSLTDRELEDIGLIRGDIDDVAMAEFIR